MVDQVTATEFQTRAGLYIESSAKNPVYITKHGRPVRVLIDVDEYERLRAYDTREAYFPRDLDDEMKAELKKGFQGPFRPDLDNLMD